MFNQSCSTPRKTVVLRNSNWKPKIKRETTQKKFALLDILIANLCQTIGLLIVPQIQTVNYYPKRRSRIQSQTVQKIVTPLFLFIRIDVLPVFNLIQEENHQAIITNYQVINARCLHIVNYCTSLSLVHNIQYHLSFQVITFLSNSS